jgi:two-component SAPR family response regulator
LAVLDIEYTQKIITPEIPNYYYPRKRLIEKLDSLKKKRLILITAPAGYGKTSVSVEFFHHIKKNSKIWISISTYDNSIENFFLLLALAFKNNIPEADFGERLKNVISKSQNIPLEQKINNIISSFANDLFKYLKDKKKELYIYLDDFHHVDESDEVCKALNYFLDYLPPSVHVIIISRSESNKINYPKFLAKNWLGKISKDDLAFSHIDINNLLVFLESKKKIKSIDKKLLSDFLVSTEGWITAVQLLLMASDFHIKGIENILQSKTDIFNYFSNEIFAELSEEEKEFLLRTSFPESINKDIIEKVLQIRNGYLILQKLYRKNVFINREDEEYRYHELFRKFINQLACEKLSAKKIKSIYISLGKHYLLNGDWRSEYIALNYLIKGKDYSSITTWIKFNASEKLLLIHSSGLYSKFEEIENKNFKNSLEYILLKVNTFVYKEKDIEKTLDFLYGILRSKFNLSYDQPVLIPPEKIGKSNFYFYVEILMLISNCNFLKEGITSKNISISEHLLKFNLKVEQEIQFIVSIVKSFISTGENEKSTFYIKRLKNIFFKITEDYEHGNSRIEENNFIESMFSLLIFFDYGDYKTGKKVVRFIMNNFDFKKFDLSNFSQICFALFISYNKKDFEFFFDHLKKKNKEKNKTIFSAYKNQFEFQSILKEFLNKNFTDVIQKLELIKQNTYLRNYIFFVDALILYCYNLIDQPNKVSYILSQNNYCVSKTRSLVLSLESYLLLNDFNSFKQTLSVIEKLGRKNFTLFNQALILFYECYYHAYSENENYFEEKFAEFIRLSQNYDYDNFILFRADTNKLNYVFEYALSNEIETEYLKNLFLPENINFELKKNYNINIDVRFLNEEKLIINNKELNAESWARPKSKMLFLYFLYQTYHNEEITKEKIINDLFHSTRSNNLQAVIDVEINKVRKVFREFLYQIVPDDLEKEVLILKDKKYFLLSEKFNLKINLDCELFKKLCKSILIDDRMRAVEIYKNDFLKDNYNNWAEDIRDNLSYLYLDTLNKLIEYFESVKEPDSLIKVLEMLVNFDISDDDSVMKLMSLYHMNKENRKLEHLYDHYEKKIKNEFNTIPSKNVQKLYFNLITSEKKIFS